MKLNEKGAIRTAYVALIAAIIVGAVVGTVVYYLTPKPKPVPKKEPWEHLKIGYAMHFLGGDWHLMQRTFNEWMAYDRGHELYLTNCRHDPVLQYKQVVHLVEDVGIDALIWTPCDETATIKVAEYCHDKGIPMMTLDEYVNSEYVLLGFGVGAVTVAEHAAESMVELLKRKYNGEAKGVVFDIEGGLDIAWGINMNKGLMNICNKYPGIKVYTAECEWDPAKAYTVTMDLFIAYGKPDVIWSGGWGDLGVSAFKAFEDKYGPNPPLGEEGHVITAGSDCSPDSIRLMKEGRWDLAFMQSEEAYPLAVYFVEQYFKYGEGGLPKVGTILTEEDLEAPLSELGGEHFGINPWAIPTWSPCEVADSGHGYPELRFKGGQIASEATGMELDFRPDDPALWPNLMEKLKEKGFHF